MSEYQRDVLDDFKIAIVLEFLVPSQRIERQTQFIKIRASGIRASGVNFHKLPWIPWNRKKQQITPVEGSSAKLTSGSNTLKPNSALFAPNCPKEIVSDRAPCLFNKASRISKKSKRLNCEFSYISASKGRYCQTRLLIGFSIT